MKKALFAMTICLLASMTACGSESTDSTPAVDRSTSTAAVAGTENGSVEVDEGIFTVEVTIPSSFIDDLDATIKAAEENEDLIEYKANDDGSVTYKYPKDVYDSKIKDMRAGFDTMVSEQLSSDNYTTLSSITGDDNLRDITLTVTSEADYGKTWDGMIIIGLYTYSGYYQIFSGDAKSVDDVKTTFHFVDGVTGEEFKTTVYPDQLEQQS